MVAEGIEGQGSGAVAHRRRATLHSCVLLLQFSDNGVILSHGL